MLPLTFGSVCSGIEAASVAWHPLGWRASWLAEIEPFPSAVLAHHYPEVPNLGDMTKLPEQILAGAVAAPDLFCGGTPCQAFSVAGLRRSLDDARGNLSLTFCEIANAIDDVRRAAGDAPCIVFWENVPGVLNTKDNAFGCFLAGLAGEADALVAPGDKWPNAGAVFGPSRAVAWRVLDAQYFGVAQRRRRVFVVASAREGFDPAAVLFEFDGVRRDTAPSREAGQRVANALTDRADRGGTNSEGQRLIASGRVQAFGYGANCKATDAARALHAHPGGSRLDFETETFTTQPAVVIRTAQTGSNGWGVNTEGVAYTLDSAQQAVAHVGIMPTLRAGAPNGGVGHGARSGDSKDEYIVPVAFNWNAQPAQLPGPDRDTSINDGLTCSQQGAVAYSIMPMNSGKDYKARETDISQPLMAGGPVGGNQGGDYIAQPVTAPVAYTTKLHNTGSNNAGKLFEERTTCLDANSPPPALLTAMQVRRLTPVECERLQGFPDDYTAIPWRKKPASECPDGPRYKALGNSWAVPNVRWIGQRIDAALFATIEDLL